MKYLIWMIVAVAVVYLFRRATRPRVEAVKRDVAPELEPMVQCTYCGVHFPESEAVTAGESKEEVEAEGRTAGIFCSAEHRRRHLGNQM